MECMGTAVLNSRIRAQLAKAAINLLSKPCRKTDLARRIHETLMS
jgi:hypothetical protein